MDERIYTERKIFTGVLLGGSLAGGYYLWRNFNVLGKPKQARAAIIVAVIVLGLTCVTNFIPALDRIPGIVFYGVQIGLAYGATRGYLSPAMNAHIEAGKALYGWGNSILVAVIAMIITLAILIPLVFISPDRTIAKHYGTLKHQIEFDPGNISEREVDRIAATLTSIGFFDEEVPKTTYAEKSGNRFIITISCSDEARSSEAIEAHKMLRAEIQKSFPSNPIVIDMVVGTLDNRIARLE